MLIAADFSLSLDMQDVQVSVSLFSWSQREREREREKKQLCSFLLTCELLTQSFENSCAATTAATATTVLGSQVSV